MSDKINFSPPKEDFELRELLRSSKYLKNYSDDKALVALTSKVSILIKEMLAHQTHGTVASILRQELMEAGVKGVIEMMKVVNIVIRRTGMGIVKAFEKDLIQIVQHIWKILKKANMDEDATILKAMRWGWPSLFPFKILHELDHSVRDIDDSWPIWPLSLPRMAMIACERCCQLTCETAAKVDTIEKMPAEKPIKPEDRQVLIKSLQKIKDKYRNRNFKSSSNSDENISLVYNNVSEGVSTTKRKLDVICLEHDKLKKRKLSKC